MNMRLKIGFATRAAGILAALLFSTSLHARAEAGDMKLEAQLIWATNDQEDPNPKHKPVSREIREKLNQLPLKWTNYFEVNRTPLDVPKGEARPATLSDKCGIEIKNLDGDKVEVALLGKGDKVLKRIQSLPKGDILILGGNAPNATAWLIALKRIK